jgi:hypothetical protein
VVPAQLYWYTLT